MSSTAALSWSLWTSPDPRAALSGPAAGTDVRHSCPRGKLYQSTHISWQGLWHCHPASAIIRSRPVLQSPEVVLRRYETLMVARPDLEEPQLKALLDEISALIVREGGIVKSIDVWGMRRLEYPIEHEESGQYAVIN